MPDDFWRKLFDDASETPPPRVWDAIEHHLNESNSSKILPLWGAGLASSRFLGWSIGAAASVALILAGWWLLRTPANQQPVSIAQRTASIVSDRASSTSNLASRSSRTLSTPTAPSVAANTKSVERLTNAHTTLEQPASITSARRQPEGSSTPIALVPAEQTRLANRESSSTAPSQPSLSTPFPSIPTAPAPPLLNKSSIESASVAESNRAIANGLSFSKNNTANLFEPIMSKSLRLRRSEQIQRIVWFRPAELPTAPETIKSKRKTRDVWASANIMPGAFDPHISVRSAMAANTSNYVALDAVRSTQVANTNQSSVASRPSFSIGYQANVGMQVSDHWSIESGIGYLVGRSTIETPAQLPTASFASSNSAYSNSLSNTATASYLTVSNYTSQTRQSTANNYQYVQVPVQVGYQLRPRKKLGLALLGGLITNIFVKNTIDNEVVITAKDGIYRPISLAASIGARFRYRPSRQWSASLAGVYQSSLGLGTQPDSQVQIRPTSAGMSFGVDYHF